MGNNIRFTHCCRPWRGPAESGRSDSSRWRIRRCRAVWSCSVSHDGLCPPPSPWPRDCNPSDCARSDGRGKYREDSRRRGATCRLPFSRRSRRTSCVWNKQSKRSLQFRQKCPSKVRRSVESNKVSLLFALDRTLDGDEVPRYEAFLKCSQMQNSPPIVLRVVEDFHLIALYETHIRTLPSRVIVHRDHDLIRPLRVCCIKW